jgi:hypothetical protein
MADAQKSDSHFVNDDLTMPFESHILGAVKGFSLICPVWLLWVTRGDHPILVLVHDVDHIRARLAPGGKTGPRLIESMNGGFWTG